MVVEVNANPYLERTSVFALAALQVGMGYSTLINHIVEVAQKRWEPTAFLKELQKSRAERVKSKRQVAKVCETGLTQLVKERDGAVKNLNPEGQPG
jgi:D-alanine-D-alanine ligase